MPNAEDETFEGRVWLLAPPVAFLNLCEQIMAWCTEHPAAMMLRRETFGSYSREVAVDACGLPVGWQQVFRAELLPWRRLYTGVKLT